MGQVCNWHNEAGESRQQTHYFHCDQIDIPREIADKDGNLVWFGDYYGWGKLDYCVIKYLLVPQELLYYLNQEYL